MLNRVCAMCTKYIGCGDWSLCCREKHGLCYEDTNANECHSFEQSAICINRSSYIGMFRCSICGYSAHERAIGDICPRCGNKIEGASWQGQKHWTGARP